MPVPEGFTVDEPTGGTSPPPGFAVDQPEQKPQIGGLEAAAIGSQEAGTFGFRPVIAGLNEAGQLSPEAQQVMRTGSPLVQLLTKPLVGAARMAYDWAAGHPDPSVMDSYERGRQTALKNQQLAQEQHPYAYLGGQLAGALATPALGAAKGVTAAGRAGYGALAGAAGSGLLGLGEATSEEQGPLETAKTVGTDIGVGGLLGGAGTAALEAARPLMRGASSIVRAIHDPEAEASRQLVNSMQTDWEQAGKTWQPLTPQQVAAADTAGTPRAIVDVMGPQTRALGEWAASVSPQAQKQIEDLTQDRLKSQAPRVAGFIQNMTGGGDLVSDLDAVQSAARRANRPAYARAYNDPSAQGMWDQGFEQIMQSPDVQQAARDAARTGANKAAAQGFTPPKNPFVWDDAGRYSLAPAQKGQQALPNLQFWDAVKQNLDDKIGAAVRAGEKGQAGDLLELKRQLVSRLDEAVPAYAQARQGAAAFFGAENALEAGSKFVQARSNMDMGQAAAAVAKMSAPEKDLFARGFATELATRITGSGDTRNVLNSVFLNNPNARGRIEMALGPDNARQIEALLRAEEVVNSTRSLYLGSPTARRLALQTTMGVGAGAAEYFGDEHPNLGTVLGTGLAAAAASRGKQILNQRVASRIGQMLVSDDPAVLAKGVQLVSRQPIMFNALRQMTAAGARVGTQAIEGGGQQRAKGGHVTANNRKSPSRRQVLPRIHPHMIEGARKARDGKWYLPDPKRPGKYLRVEGRK